MCLVMKYTIYLIIILLFPHVAIVSTASIDNLTQFFFVLMVCEILIVRSVWQACT